MTNHWHLGTLAQAVNSTLPVLIDALENVQDEIAAKCRVLPGPFIQQLKSLFDNFEPTFSLAPFIQKLSMARVRACCAGAKTMGPDAARSAAPRSTEAPKVPGAKVVVITMQQRRWRRRRRRKKSCRSTPSSYDGIECHVAFPEGGRAIGRVGSLRFTGPA